MGKRSSGRTRAVGLFVKNGLFRGAASKQRKQAKVDARERKMKRIICIMDAFRFLYLENTGTRKESTDEPLSSTS